MHQGFTQLDPLVADHEELAEVLGRARDSIADDGPWTHSRDLLKKTRTVVKRLVGLGRLDRTDDLPAVDLATDTAELERAAQALQAATDPLLQTLPELLDDATDLSLSAAEPERPGSSGALPEGATPHSPGDR